MLYASALLALLRDEPGARNVAEVLADARISSVNYSEVVSHFINAGMPAQQVDAMLSPLPVTAVEADRGFATSAGHLRTVTAKVGLSLGDRFCRELAKRDGLHAMTADKQWRTIADTSGVTVVLIR